MSFGRIEAWLKEASNALFFSFFFFGGIEVWLEEACKATSICIFYNFNENQKQCKNDRLSHCIFYHFKQCQNYRFFSSKRSYAKLAIYDFQFFYSFSWSCILYDKAWIKHWIRYHAIVHNYLLILRKTKPKTKKHNNNKKVDIYKM